VRKQTKELVREVAEPLLAALALATIFLALATIFVKVLW